MKYKFEVGIIGGGPAGSTAAAYLTQYGFDVCVFEKKSFPRETLCGEFLSSEVVHLLKELNLYNEFISLHPNQIKSFRFFNVSGESESSKFNFDAYGLSRSLFDNLLLCNAKRKGVIVFQPAEIKNIIKEGESYRLITKDDENFKVKHVIAAYGKQNPLDNFLNRSFVNYKSKLNGIKFQINKNELNDFANDEIQIYTADNIYCGVNAVENDKVTFCFLEDRNKEQFPPRKQLINLQEKNKSFEKLFADKNLFTDPPVYGTGNIYFGKRNLVENGIFMIGDAAGIIAPLAGDGIGIAMESGKLLAELLHRREINNISDNELKYLYTMEWKKLFSKRMITAKIIQGFILKNFSRNLGWFLIKNFKSLLPYLIKSTRNNFGNKI